MPESKHRRRRSRGRAGPASNRRSPATAAPYRPRQRKTNWWMLAASGIVAILVIAGFVIGDIAGTFGARGGSASEYEEGVGVQQSLMPSSEHVPVGQTVAYSTIPPTSGDHWARWSNCGFYEQELPDELTVHNLEHGNIVVSYNLTGEDVDRLRDVINGIGLANNNGVARLYSQIPQGQVALAAWGVSDSMVGIDQERIERFFRTYAGTLGPERIPCLGTGIDP